jgi:hypothetical protein
MLEYSGEGAEEGGGYGDGSLSCVTNRSEAFCVTSK